LHQLDKTVCFNIQEGRKGPHRAGTEVPENDLHARRKLRGAGGVKSLRNNNQPMGKAEWIIEEISERGERKGLD